MLLFQSKMSKTIKALCKSIPKDAPKNDKGVEKLKALTCGSLFNFLSVGLMIFCTLLKL